MTARHRDGKREAGKRKQRTEIEEQKTDIKL